jgi:cytochrome c551/c552
MTAAAHGVHRFAHDVVITLLITPLIAALASANAHASQQLAFDLGCINCHGDSSSKAGPGLAELARRYAKYRGDAKAQKELADKLRAGSHIAAHAQLSEASAASLIRWISDGAPQ